MAGVQTAYVPGTHRLPGRPQTTLARVGLDISGVWKDRGSLHDDSTLGQRLMPNHFESAFPANSAIAFDSAGWHTSVENTVPGLDRCGAHYAYSSSGKQGNAQEWGPKAGLSEATLRRLDSQGKLGVVRRRILGLPDAGTG